MNSGLKVWVRHGIALVIAVVATTSLSSCTESKAPEAIPAPTPTKTAAVAPVQVDLPVDPIVLTPVAWLPLTPHVTPVKSTDGKIHVTYELWMMNLSPGAVTIKSIEAIDPTKNGQRTGASSTVSIKDEDITGLVRVFGRPVTFTRQDFGSSIPAGQSGVVYVDLTYNEMAEIPKRIKHRIVESTAQNPEIIGIGGVVDIVDQAPVVMGPLFRGPRWFAGYGCCKIVSPHRYTLLPANGTLRSPERYAIDFVQLDEGGNLFKGDIKNLENWHLFKSEILSGSAGRVAVAVDGQAESVPGKLPAGLTVEHAPGNHVIVDMGNGHYAMYAHLATGTVKVKVGDNVTRGQVLGLLGNTGNSDSPHLHFQVMDRPSALDANGLPFVFDEMEFEGIATGTIADLDKDSVGGIPFKIDASGKGTRKLEYPKNLDVIGFK